MNIDNFQIKWNGKLLDFDKYAGVQCADGARQWVEDKDGWDMESAFFKPYRGNVKYGDDGVLDGFYSFKSGYISVVKNREIMGATNPKDAAKGTIRNLYGISLDKNSVWADQFVVIIGFLTKLNSSNGRPKPSPLVKLTIAFTLE